MSLNRLGKTVDLVFECWRKHQPNPDRVRLTQARRKLIRDRLKSGFTSDDLCNLVRYAHEAEADEARFWRGDNDRDRTFLGLDNLLRSTKLPDRVDRANAWVDKGGEVGEEDEDVVLDPIAALRLAARRS